MSACFFQGIQQWEMGSLSKALEYLSCYLSSTFQHPLKSMEDTDMLLFLCGVLQVYLQFWYSSNPFEEYVPDFIKTSRCVQDECTHMITETVSLLKQIRSCQVASGVANPRGPWQLRALQH